MSKRWGVSMLAVLVVLFGWNDSSFAKPQKALIPIQMERCMEKFEWLDVNGDGILSPDEFSVIADKPDPRVDRVFKERDADGDGSLTQGEMCARRGGLRTKKPAAKPPAPVQ